MIPEYRALKEVIKKGFTDVKFGEATAQTPLKCTAKYDNYTVFITVEKSIKDKPFIFQVNSRFYSFETELDLRQALKGFTSQNKRDHKCNCNGSCGGNCKCKAKATKKATMPKDEIPEWRIKELHDKARAYIFEHDMDNIYTEDHLKTIEACFDIITMWWKPYPEECKEKILRGMFGMSEYEIAHFCESLTD